ncbi:MAG: alpha/beta hydrolase [Lachnospiraceae bacterium]|nr:alpha/beta hydrolase [Lachnospiraceae bacterium]
MSYLSLSNGERIYYEDTGKGEQTVIMMHGWTSTHEVFAPCVPEISKVARCITYDHRGHGNSKEANRDHVTMDTLASDLDELIRGLGLSDVTLLGWSMGAGVAMNYMSIYGCDALRRVVLCDMTPKQMNDDDWHLGLYQGKYTKQDMERDAGKSFYALYKAFAIAAIPKLAKVPGFLLRRPLKKQLSKCDEKTLRTLSVSMKEKDFRRSVEQITVPFFYFYAVPGSLFSPKLAEWYRIHVHTPFKAVAFENSTHMLISDHPDKFAREVIRIIEE